jgi:hypothetical protein
MIVTILILTAVIFAGAAFFWTGVRLHRGHYNEETAKLAADTHAQIRAEVEAAKHQGEAPHARGVLASPEPEAAP